MYKHYNKNIGGLLFNNFKNKIINTSKNKLNGAKKQASQYA